MSLVLVVNVQPAGQVDEARVIVCELRLEHRIGNVGTAEFEPGDGERSEQRQQDDGEDFQVQLRARSGAPAPRRLGLKDILFSLAKSLYSRKKRHYHDLSCLRNGDL